MIGYAADAAAAEEAMKKRGEIRQHFPSFFCVGPMRERPLTEELSAARERTERFFAQISGGQISGGREGIVPLGRGGVLKGLWDLGEKYSSGMEADIHKIPVRQETIEICEYLNLDPYYADSAGSFLLAAADGHLLLEECRKRGIAAALIGVLGEERARVIRFPGHTRYLDKPRAYL